ncbi:vegetative protein [Neisseria bacilliformis ATCC BAA-1200]|uniref:Vegetative protein n=1 Tax=Neisseria bacilliformis ATCC BAA-1200 TaxID=888742 RepID=F2BGD4_9NEIS|nr:vegetative protein [Neisseria bacilliformis ATCC BAA-1200]
MADAVLGRKSRQNVDCQHALTPKQPKRPSENPFAGFQTASITKQRNKTSPS